MSRASPRPPTPAELEILRVLWSRGPSTVREVHEELQRHRESGYTTVLKLLQIMVEKGHVERIEGCRPQVYRARRSRLQTQRQFLRDLSERLFAGSAGQLAMQALSLEPASPEEIEEIRALLDAMEERHARKGGERRR